MITEFSLTGGSFSVNANGKMFTLTGSGTLKMSTQEGGYIPKFFPTELSFNNIALNINNQLSVAGKLVMRGQVVAKDGTNSVFPTEFQLQGGYTNAHSGTSLTNGNIHATWDNPGDNPTADKVQSTLVVVGTLTTARHQTFQADITFHTDGNGAASLTITKLGWTTEFLTGSGHGTIDADGNITEASLTITNQDGITIALDQNYDGTIGGADQQGTIAKDANGVKVTFKDDSFLYLIGNAGPG